VLNRLPIYIDDGSRISYRGVMIDTARHFIPVKKIKEVIRQMQYSKLNILHWHITDSESFPLELVKP
jgi:hexosaminidase